VCPAGQVGSANSHALYGKGKDQVPTAQRNSD